MKQIEELVALMQAKQQGIKFKDLVKVCDHYFEKPRQVGSHIIYKTPWLGDPKLTFKRVAKRQNLIRLNKCYWQ